MINCGNDSVLSINIYMLVENEKKTHVDPEFIIILEAVDMYIEQCNIRKVILAGDFNVDFSLNMFMVYILRIVVYKNRFSVYI